MSLRDATPDNCETCGRPTLVCVCDRLPHHTPKRRVLILQHPREQDVVLGTATLVAQALDHTTLSVGMSWRSLAHALGEKEADPHDWGVLFPGKADDKPAAHPGMIATDRNGERVRVDKLKGIVVLDGSWSQAKTLWWRNAWLLKLNRLQVTPKEPSIYGKLREEPRREFVSTLEAVGAALTACGETPSIEADLRRAFRTMIQRARDAGLGAPAPRRPVAPKPRSRRPR